MKQFLSFTFLAWLGIGLQSARGDELLPPGGTFPIIPGGAHDPDRPPAPLPHIERDAPLGAHNVPAALFTETQHIEGERTYAMKHLPTKMFLKPALIPWPQNFGMPIEATTIEHGFFDLLRITPSMIAALSTDNLKALLLYLKKVPVNVKWRDQFGKTISRKRTAKHRHRLWFGHWEQSNAAAALSLSIAIQQGSEALSTLVALGPQPILPIFDRDAASVFSDEIAASILIKMLEQFDGRNGPNIAQSAAQFVQTYFHHWARKNAKRGVAYFGNLVLKIAKVRPHFDEARLGLLFGSLIAGVLKHSNAIRAKDDRRLWLFNSAAAVIWSAINAFAFWNLPEPVIGVGSGLFAITAMFESSFFNGFRAHRDFTPYIREIEGKIEMAGLAAAREGGERRYDILMVLSWMRAAIHVNGLAD